MELLNSISTVLIGAPLSGMLLLLLLAPLAIAGMGLYLFIGGFFTVLSGLCSRLRAWYGVVQYQKRLEKRAAELMQTPKPSRYRPD